MTNRKRSKAFIKIKQNIEHSVSIEQIKVCKTMLGLADSILWEGEKEELVDRMLAALIRLRQGKNILLRQFESEMERNN